MSTIQDVDTDTFVMLRPQDITDGRWEAMKSATFKIMTGHFPWCTEHEGDPKHPDSYCTSKRETAFGSIMISTGTTSGEPMIWLHTHDGEHITELDLMTAACIAVHLDMLVTEAAHGNFPGAVGERSKA